MKRFRDLFLSLFSEWRSSLGYPWHHAWDLARIAVYELAHKILFLSPGDFMLSQETVAPDMRQIFRDHTRPIAILPLFESTRLNRLIIYFTARVAWEVFGAPVRILRFRPPWQEVVGQKEQLDGDQILDRISDHSFLKNYGRVLLLTDQDVFSGGNRWVYGYAGVIVPVCAVSVYRLGFEDVELPEDVPVSSWRMFLRVLVHELGHTYGLNHCPYESCIMHDVPDEGLLALQPRFCTSCREKIKLVKRRTTRPHRNR